MERLVVGGGMPMGDVNEAHFQHNIPSSLRLCMRSLAIMREYYVEDRGFVHRLGQGFRITEK